jgi:hypothetical protein
VIGLKNDQLPIEKVTHRSPHISFPDPLLQTLLRVSMGIICSTTNPWRLCFQGFVAHPSPIHSVVFGKVRIATVSGSDTTGSIPGGKGES